MKVNGWLLYIHPIFSDLLDSLIQEVKTLQENKPSEYLSHPKTLLLRAVYKCIKVIIPSDPKNSCFLLGATLGKKYKGIRRAKEFMLKRYRLFFRFDSRDNEIFYLWFNDESTYRKKGAVTDVYAVFRKMLENKTVPTELQDLRESSKELI